jgi:hypothetical protein
MKLRVVTWNMDHRKKVKKSAWDFLRHGPELNLPALVQICPYLPPEVAQRWYRSLFCGCIIININYINRDSAVLRIQRSEVRILSGTPRFPPYGH